MRARAEMESASTPRQSLRAAGMKLPEGLSACGVVGVTRAYQLGLARFVHAVDRKDVLGEIDAHVQNSLGLPLASELMRFATPSWHSLPVAASRLARDGEVSSIR